MNMSEQSGITFKDLGNGIYVYSNVLPRELNIPERVESSLKDNSAYQWQPAYVGYQQLMPDYRDCVDF